MALYSIVNQFRYQRQPYCEIRVLTEGDAESEQTLKSFLIVDNMNPTYNMDFNKFLSTITGGGGVGAGPAGAGHPGAAYY